MARIRKTPLFLIIFIVVIAVAAGGYFVRKSTQGGAAASADSTAADSTLAKADSSDTEEDDEKKGPDPVPVEISIASPRQISSYYYTTASLEPERKVDLLAKVVGQVTGLKVEEGDLVEAGALLCQIEEGELRVTLDEARINKDQQEREFNRIKSMYDERLVSDKEFSDAKYQFELASNKHEAAKVRYEHTKVRAPFKGVVTKRYVDLGQNLGVGTQLFEIADTEPLLVRMYLPENEVKDIRLRQVVTIEPDNQEGVSLTVRVIRISPEVDQRTGTVKVTAETYGTAMPGSFARIKVVTDTRKGSLTIPRRGLISDAGELYVYVAQADSVVKADVQVGYQDEQFAEVLNGVELGDSVVVVGTGGLRTGTKIKVLEPTMQEELTRQDQDSSAASN
jgi:membrane fusion protein (multidrug efflux system)